MPYVSLNIFLEKSVATGDTIAIAYPQGRKRSDLRGGSDHTIGINDLFFRSPKDFLLNFEHEHIAFTWLRQETIRAGSLLHFSIEDVSRDYYFDRKSGTIVQQMVSCPTFMINLNAPLPAKQSYFGSNLSPDPGGDIPLVHHEADVPRNLTIYSSEDNHEVLFRLSGKDFYDNTIVQEIHGIEANQVIETSKTFARLDRVTAGRNARGNFSLGIGRILGLPVVIPGAGYILNELLDDQVIEKGTLITADHNAPTPASGDARGGYIPHESVHLDGKSNLNILAMLISPGNIGASGQIRN